MDRSDMPYVVLGALAATRDESIKTVEDMVKKGKEISSGAKSKATKSQKSMEGLLKELIEKGKKESDQIVEAVGKAVKDSLATMGIVTKSDLKSLEKRLATVEKKIGARKPAKKKAARKPAKKKAAKKAARKPARKKAAKKAARKPARKK